MHCVIYDGNCNLCVNLVRILESLDSGQHFRYVPMQDEQALAEYDITPSSCEQGMILVDLDSQQRWQGSAAAEEIGRILPLGKLFVEAYRALPGAQSAGDQLYAYVRDNRYDLFGQRDQTYWSKYPTCSSEQCSGGASEQADSV